jgi:hypothetical protein
MKFGERTYFISVAAVSFSLGVMLGIFLVWPYVPSVKVPTENVAGSIVRPIAVRTITIKAPPALASDIKEHPGLFGSPSQHTEYVDDELITPRGFTRHPHILPPLRIIK